MAPQKKVVKTYGKRSQRTLLSDNWLSPESKESSNFRKTSNAFLDLSNDSTFCEETTIKYQKDKQLENELCNLLWSNLEVSSPDGSPVLVPETPEAEIKQSFCRQRKKPARKNDSLPSDECMHSKDGHLSSPDMENDLEIKGFKNVFVKRRIKASSNEKENKQTETKKIKAIGKVEKFEPLDENSVTVEFEERTLRRKTFTSGQKKTEVSKKKNIKRKGRRVSIFGGNVSNLEDLSKEEHSLIHTPCEVKLTKLVLEKTIQHQGTPDMSSSKVWQSQDTKANIIHEKDVENNESIGIENYIPAHLSPIVEPTDLQDQFWMERSSGNIRKSLTPFRGKRGKILSASEKVLLHCGQSEVLPFSSVFTEKELEDCWKIGEGVYGEVFQMKLNDEKVAVKIIPIEGDLVVNDESQKTFGEILPEIVISKELSSLREPSFHGQTNHFIEVKAVHCCQGQFPPDLLRAWDEFEAQKGSDNDRPDSYCDQQLFIVFVFANGGCDLESFKFGNVLQMKSVLQQTIGALAVAEATLQFEHRDLHWGNVLVKKLEDGEHQQIVLGEESFEVAGCGLHVSIIDFTLSRLHKDGCTLFFDLSTDECLFQGEGDYQFDMYRLMRTQNKNEWDSFNAYSNVLWLHYLTRKLLEEKKVKKSRKKVHQQTLRQLKTFERELLNFKSAQEIIKLSKLFIS